MPTLPDQDLLVHATAVVEPGATIGSGTRVWHHAHVRDGATVGRDCVVSKNVYVDAGVTVGDRVKIQNNVSVYTGVTLDDEVFVGPSAVFTNDRFPRAVNADWAVVTTRVRRGASIGANATIVCGVELGAWCVVAAGAVVTRPVAPHQVVAGNPARHLGWACRCGRLVSRDPEPSGDLDCPGCGATSLPGPGRPRHRPTHDER